MCELKILKKIENNILKLLFESTKYTLENLNRTYNLKMVPQERFAVEQIKIRLESINSNLNKISK